MQDIQALIPIAEQSIGGNSGIPTVNGRHIWHWLQIHRDYSNWVKNQIESLDLAEDKHYVKLAEKGELSKTGQIKIEYHFTLTAAKHIVMASRTRRGGEARDYFIAIEERYYDRPQADLTSGDALVRMAEAYREQERRLKAVERRQQEEQRLLMQAQQDMIELQQGVIEAKETALTAIQAMQWVTIRQYIEIYRMHRQCPPSVQRSYAVWLTTYCQERGHSMYKAATADKDWPFEKTYCIAVIHDTLKPWLKRRDDQDQFLG